jgi:hypothetical protein
MEKSKNTLILEPDIGGTSGISFQVTGVAEQWHPLDAEETDIGESGQVFTTEEFLRPPKKASRKVRI